MRTVGLVVNTYERTYRDVLSAGYFPQIAELNRRSFDEVVALINNVDDAADAQRRAQALVDAGEITSYAFVRDLLPAALQHSGLGASALRRRPYLLDYGLVMPHAVATDWLLGWDAETTLDEPRDWVTEAIELMERDPRVFHAGLNWHPMEELDPGLASEAVETIGDYALNYGFSDQLFLLRRQDLLDVRWRAFAPAAIVRHAPHPYTFEFRVESHQRSVGRMRATRASLFYSTRTSPAGVVDRTGATRLDRAQLRLLRALEHHIIRRVPRSTGPRWSL